MPVDFYTGGAEHAVMHLMYARFFTKALRDLDFVETDEPFTRLFNQGMIHGEDGFVMSKSRGNVVNPLDMIEKYGADALRLALVSFSSPDKDTDWDENVLNGNFKFIKKVFFYFDNAKDFAKTDERTESKLNKSIKNITEFIENLKYNYAIIELRSLFNSLPEKTSKDVLEKFLKLLQPFCPHIAEEFWERLGNKGFISVAKWPQFEENKINENLERDEKNIGKLADDINSIQNLFLKENKKAETAYIYVIPNEKKLLEDSVDMLEKKTKLKIKVYLVNDKNRYDPQEKSKRAKPGKPALYLE
jgi:leucyl-tRNA synthetase